MPATKRYRCAQIGFPAPQAQATQGTRARMLVYGLPPRYCACPCTGSCFWHGTSRCVCVCVCVCVCNALAQYSHPWPCMYAVQRKDKSSERVDSEDEEREHASKVRYTCPLQHCLRYLS